MWTLTSWLLYGRFAVDVFIVLSGFCLMLPIVRSRDGWLVGGARTFFLKRARRILPPYYFACALSLLLILSLIGQPTGTHWDVSLPVSGLGIFAHLLLIQDVLLSYVGYQLNGVFWSIAIEWHIYFVFPLLVILWRKVGPLATTVLAVLVAGVAWFLLRSTPFSGVKPYYLALFVLGMFAAHTAFSTDTLGQVLRRRFPWKVSMCAFFFLVVGLCTVWGWQLAFRRLALLDVLIGLFAVCLLVVLVQEHATGLFRRMFSWRPLVWIGTFAYSLYLIHFPLQQVVWQYVLHPLAFGDVATFALLALVGTPVIVGCTYAFILCFEKPFLRRGGRASIVYPEVIVSDTTFR